MKNLSFFLYFQPLLAVSLCVACGPHKPTVAELREQHRLERMQQDSIMADQKARTVVFCDSMTAVLQPQVEEQLRKFKYERNERYEDHGHYVHPLLNTERNAERCYLQPYVSDDLVITIRSYYYGSRYLNHTAVLLEADSVALRLEGTYHRFETTAMDGSNKSYKHEIMTLRDEQTRQLLSFVDAYREGRIQVTLEGDAIYRYVLSPRDKQALLDTYQLGVLMRDMQHLAAMRNQATK